MSEQKLILTDEEKIKILNDRIDNFKEQLQDKSTFTYSLYSSNSPKKDHIRAWGEALEDLHTLGVYKDDICTISTHIRRELKTLGIPQAIETAKKALPLKYKDSAKIHAGILLEDELRQIRGTDYPGNTKTREELELLNKRYIEELDADIEVLQKAKQYLSHHELMSKVTPGELDEYFTRKEATRRHLTGIMDGRSTVPPSLFHLFMYAFTESTKSGTFGLYLKYINIIKELTPKQAVKLITGRVTKVDQLYEPLSYRDAKMANFQGTKCGECGSFRQDVKYHTDLKEDKLYCYACKNWNELKTEKLLSKMI